MSKSLNCCRNCQFVGPFTKSIIDVVHQNSNQISMYNAMTYYTTNSSKGTMNSSRRSTSAGFFTSMLFTIACTSSTSMVFSISFFSSTSLSWLSLSSCLFPYLLKHSSEIKSRLLVKTPFCISYLSFFCKHFFYLISCNLDLFTECRSYLQAFPKRF